MLEKDVEKTAKGALLQKYHAGVKGFFKDEEAVRMFDKMEGVEERLEFIWRSQAMQTFLRDGSEKDGGKSEGDTKRFRDFGNNHFKAGRDKDAVRLFGAAARSAPVKDGKGRDLSLALANRSAALVRLQQSELALEDIEAALEAGYPEELRYKLLDRRLRLHAARGERELYHDNLSQLAQALAASTLEEGKREEMKRAAEELLTTLQDKPVEVEEKEEKKSKGKVEVAEACPFLPALSNWVDIEWNKVRGRFALANRAIPAGTLLLVEEPQAAVVVGEADVGARCDQCLKKTELVTTPCLNCSHVSYCSPACRDLAKGAHHQYECGMRGLLKALSGSQATRDMGRLGFRALCKYPASWYSENRETLHERLPMFGDEAWEKTMQHALLSLDHHPESVDPGRLWSFLLCALCHLRALQMGGYFGPSRAGEVAGKLTKEEVQVAGWSVRLLQVEQYNMQGITGGTELDSTIGHGLYPTASLINHSCDSNITKCFTGSKIVLVASRDIQEREEVVDCYLPAEGHQMERDQRRAWLHHFYRFLCECPACLMEGLEQEQADTTDAQTDKKEVQETEASTETTAEKPADMKTNDPTLTEAMEAA